MLVLRNHILNNTVIISIDLPTLRYGRSKRKGIRQLPRESARDFKGTKAKHTEKQCIPSALHTIDDRLLRHYDPWVIHGLDPS